VWGHAVPSDPVELPPPPLLDEPPDVEPDEPPEPEELPTIEPIDDEPPPDDPPPDDGVPVEVPLLDSPLLDPKVPPWGAPHAAAKNATRTALSQMRIVLAIQARITRNALRVTWLVQKKGVLTNGRTSSHSTRG
jgi:hypothetical protein